MVMHLTVLHLLKIQNVTLNSILNKIEKIE